MKEKKTELSILNVFFCLLVIFIHVSSNPITFLIKGSLGLAAVYAPWKLASFVVYGFLFLGGLKFALHPPRDGVKGLWEYYKKRLLRIVVPYVIWVLIYDLWNHFALGEELSVSSCLYSVWSGTAASHFYYLVIAIQLYALAPLWKRIKASSAPVVLPIALVLTILFSKYLPDILLKLGYSGEVLNDRIFTSYMFYWIAGVYAGLMYKEYCDLLLSRKAALSVFFALCAVPEVYCTYRTYVYGDYFPFNPELHIVFICASILFWSMIALKLKNLSFFSSRPFQALDRCTFSVYLSHLLVMKEWDLIALGAFPSLGVFEAFPIRMLITYAVSIVLCMSAAAVIRKIKPSIQGKKTAEK